MTAYLYVLWAVEDGLVKIGISKRLTNRLSAHAGNSSNPTTFEQWRLFQFTDVNDAKKAESLALHRLTKRGLRYRNKRELFKCSPTMVTDVVEEVCAETGLSALKNFPFDVEQALSTFADYPSLPEYALEMCTQLQRGLYWRGVRDVLSCLSYLDGIAISRHDLLKLHQVAPGRERINAELWPAIVDHYRNLGSASAKKIASTALEKSRCDVRFAYLDWQQLTDNASFSR